MPASPVDGAPQIRLHQAQATTGLRRLAQADAAFGTPYWAYPWGGGLALARYLLERPQICAGRRVLDLGAGSGLVAIAAAKAGAREVLAADIDPYACVAAGLNAALNGVSLEVLAGDLTGGPPPAVDLVLAGDLFYEQALADRAIAFLRRCLGVGLEVLIGDPGRAWLPRRQLQELASYAVADFGDRAGGAVSTSWVFRLRSPS